MLRRLYFVLPDVDTAQQVEKELLLARIEDRHIHFLAREGTDLGDLPQASVAQRSDYFHAMGAGLLAGACSGAAVGVGAFVYLGLSMSMVGMIAALAIIGAIFGVWVAGIIGASVPNTRLTGFQHTIEEGHVLLMVDLRLDQVEMVQSLIKKYHPEAEDHGLDPTVPAFP